MNTKLDSLRAWAALGVVGYHCNYSFPLGWLGVVAFYVLSGYLVTKSWFSVGRELAGIGQARGFWLRRARRILPLYFFYLLLLMAGMLLGLFSWLTWSDFPSLWGGYFSWMLVFQATNISFLYSHLWSLSVEFQFYLVLPLFFLLVPKHWQVRALWGMVFLAPVLRGLLYALLSQWGYGKWDAAFSVYSCPLTYLDAFALGILLFLSPPRGDYFRNLILYLLFLLTFLVCFSWGVYLVAGVFPSITPTLFDSYFSWIWGYSLVFFLFYFFVSWLTSDPVGLGLFDNPVTRYLGRISYGIYVYQMPVVGFGLYFFGLLGKDIDHLPSVPWYVVLLFFGISCIPAALSHRYLEQRFFRAL